MDATTYEPQPYEIALFEQDLEPRIYPCDIGREPPGDAMAYLHAVDDAAHAGVPFGDFSEEQLARLEDRIAWQLGIDPDFRTGADD